MANIQLKSFPVKSAPVGDDTIYVADSANNGNEVQVSISSILGSLENPVSVPNGGTGNESFSANSLISSGTTATGALQTVSNASAVGGQVLTYVSSSALPHWASISIPAQTYLTISGNMTATQFNVVYILPLGGGNATLTLPSVSTVSGYPYVTLVNFSANLLTIIPTSGDTIDFGRDIISLSQGDAITLTAIANNVWQVTDYKMRPSVTFATWTNAGIQPAAGGTYPIAYNNINLDGNVTFSSNVFNFPLAGIYSVSTGIAVQNPTSASGASSQEAVTITVTNGSYTYEASTSTVSNGSSTAAARYQSATLSDVIFYIAVNGQITPSFTYSASTNTPTIDNSGGTYITIRRLKGYP